MSVFGVIAMLLNATTTRGAVSLPAMFGDHMVLQRGAPIPIFGSATSGESITVEFDGQKKSTRAGEDGKWRIDLDAHEAGGPFELIVTGEKGVTKFVDVLVGEVWIASGQSNMEMPLRDAIDGQNEAKKSNYPSIRMLQVPHVASDDPKTDFAGEWTSTTPESAAQFSAVAQYFGRRLQSEIDVPIGLICAHWNGTAAQAWIPKERLIKVPGFEKFARSDEMETQLYNGMIHPLTPYGIRGVIWYQGESNAETWRSYQQLMTGLIESWREDFQRGDFPFIQVQLAGFQTDVDDPSLNPAWANLRDAQRKIARAIKNVFLATAIDVGDEADIHPRNKKDVGERLARQALKNVYGKNVVQSGPTFRSKSIDGNKVTIAFENVGTGLKVKGTLAKNFALCDESGKWAWADARIEGSSVVLSANGIEQPTKVRFCWQNSPPIGLFNSENLPAFPFEE